MNEDANRKAAPLPGRLHTDGQWAAVTNADGTLLLVAGWDGRAVMWRPGADENWTPEVLTEAPEGAGKEAAILSASLSPSQNDLVLGTFGGKIRLWRNPGNGFELSQTLHDEGTPVRAIAYSPDGRNVAAGDNNGDLWVWDVDGGGYARRSPVPAHRGILHTIAFDKDGRMVTGGSDGRVRRSRTNEDRGATQTVGWAERCEARHPFRRFPGAQDTQRVPSPAPLGNGYRIPEAERTGMQLNLGPQPSKAIAG